MCIKTQLKKRFNQFYTKPDILTQTILLPAVDWDENDLLFTKRLQMMN